MKWLLHTSSAGDIQWALSDHVSTIRDIATWDSTSSEFEVANHRVYNSFGELESETDASVDLDYGYTSQFFDEATGMAHHLNRWFDPGLGKWLSDDPMGFAAGDVNLQRYVGNRPMTFIDPTGLWGGGTYQDSDPRSFDDDIDQGQQRTREMVDITSTNISPAWAAAKEVGSIVNPFNMKRGFDDFGASLISGDAGRNLADRAIRIVEKQTGTQYTGTTVRNGGLHQSSAAT